MIVPDLKGVVKGLLEPLNFTETLTSALGSPSTLFARKTGTFGRRSRHAVILDETGPKRSVPTATTALGGAGTLSQTAELKTASIDATSIVNSAPEVTAMTVEIEGRQLQASRSTADDVTTIKTTALIIVESSTTRTILTEASTTSTTPTSLASSTVTQTSTSTSSTEPTSTASSTPTPTSSPSSKPPIGAIAGGAIGGFFALLLALFLIAFLVRRHRKKIEKRRLAEANPFFPKHSTPPPPPSLYQDRPGGGGHNRSNSTSHDIYGTMGGGGGTTSSRTNFRDEKKARLIDNNSLQANPAPGLRAEGGPGLPPAAFLRPAQMLDGRPINEIGGMERPRSVRSSGSRFEEHLAVEMEDSSSFHNTTPTRNKQHAPPPSSTYSQDSPILCHHSAFSTSAASPSSLASDVTRRQHLMSWSTYASDGDGEEEMSATLNSSKTPPSARSTPSEVSPQSGEGGRGQLLLDSTYVVSPLRKNKF